MAVATSSGPRRGGAGGASFAEAIRVIKEHVLIPDLLRDSGTRINQQGKISCLWHSDEHPSAQVHDDYIKCHACGHKADVLDLWQALHGGDLRAAVEGLAPRAGVVLRPRSDQDEADFQRRKRAREAVQVAHAVYADALWEDTPIARQALEYLEGRGISRGAAKAAGLGLAAGWGRAEAKLSGKGAEWVQAGLAAGVIVPRKKGSGNVDHLHHALIFPVPHKGDVRTLIGRVFPGVPERSKAIESGAKSLRLPSGAACAEPAPPLWWPKRERADRWVLVGGEMDALCLRQAEVGIHAVALLGDRMASHPSLGRQLGGDVVFWTDHDRKKKDEVPAGRKAAGELAMQLGPRLRMVEWTEDKDPNDALMRLGMEAFKAVAHDLVDEAAPWLDWECGRIRAEWPDAPLAWAKAVRDHIVPVLAAVDDPMELTAHVDGVCKALELRGADLRKAIAAHKAAGRGGGAEVLQLVVGGGAGAPEGDGEAGGSARLVVDADLKLECTDIANAARLVRLAGEDLRWCAGLGWLAWDGRRWRIDDQGEVIRRAKGVARMVLEESADHLTAAAEARRRNDDDTAKMHLERAGRLEKWAVSSSSKERIKAAVDLAAPEIAVAVGDLDRDPYLITCWNGTVDLRCGALRPFDRADLITKMADADFDPAAVSPTWTAFLERAFDGSRDLIAYVQRAAGYSMTGSVGEQCLFFCHGSGRNGKGVFLETLQALLGDYAHPAPEGLLMAAQGDKHPAELADLQGVRMVVDSETERGKAFAESRVKKLTGGDAIQARRMRQDFITIRPTWSIWLASNYKPAIRGVDEGIWSRIRLIPFEVTIPKAERDRDLPQKLLAERAGVFAWMVAGAREWCLNRLGEPDKILRATEGYRREEDVFGQFIGDRCLVKSGEVEGASELYKAYLSWVEEVGVKAWSQVAFGRALAERGFERDKPNTGVWRKKWTWGGIRLRRMGELDLEDEFGAGDDAPEDAPDRGPWQQETPKGGRIGGTNSEKGGTLQPNEFASELDREGEGAPDCPTKSPITGLGEPFVKGVIGDFMGQRGASSNKKAENNSRIGELEDAPLLANGGPPLGGAPLEGGQDLAPEEEDWT